jgi:hypothetical protein
LVSATVAPFFGCEALLSPASRDPLERECGFVPTMRGYAEELANRRPISCARTDGGGDTSSAAKSVTLNRRSQRNVRRPLPMPREIIVSPRIEDNCSRYLAEPHNAGNWM